MRRDKERRHAERVLLFKNHGLGELLPPAGFSMQELFFVAHAMPDGRYYNSHVKPGDRVSAEKMEEMIKANEYGGVTFSGQYGASKRGQHRPVLAWGWRDHADQRPPVCKPRSALPFE